MMTDTVITYIVITDTVTAHASRRQLHDRRLLEGPFSWAGPLSSGTHALTANNPSSRRQLRDRRLLELLDEYAGTARETRVIVFCLYRRETGRVGRLLAGHGYPAAVLSGDMEQVSVPTVSVPVPDI
jgi:hypothetical protein